MADVKPRFIGVELYFDDLERAKRFYRDTVGLELSEEMPGHHAKFEAAAGFLCLERKGSESYPSRDKAVTFLQVSDLQAAIDRIGRNQMVQIEPQGSGGHPPWAVLHDPEGHNVLLVQTSDSSHDPSRQLLRHTVATLAYRGGKALHGAPEGFAEFRVSETTRTPGQILAHLADLLDWGLALAKGNHEWHDSPPLPWEKGVQRFFTALEAFEAYLASGLPLGFPAEKLFQGPIADALTHVGQIAMLRRLAGAPVRGEDYFRAEIAVGRIGPQQAAPRRELD